jgi:anti-anti-sigma factor
LEIQSTIRQQVSVVSIAGSVDALTSGHMTGYLTDQVDQGYKHLVLDLSQVEYMSSAGLRSILEGLKFSRQAGGDLRLAAPQPGIEKMLKMAGFTSIRKTYASLDEAVNSFGDG